MTQTTEFHRRTVVTLRAKIAESLSGYLYSLSWIPDIWSHYRKAQYHLKRGEFRFAPTRLSDCLRATIALILNLEDIDMEFCSTQEVAWRDAGRYMTDYGEGRAWEYLAVRGWHYTLGSDGSL